jgi:hypothetical protein
MYRHWYYIILLKLSKLGCLYPVVVHNDYMVLVHRTHHILLLI